eukprot:SAG31_NODE_4538_length_3155_cov_5.869437_1_plen_99_part_00
MKYSRPLSGSIKNLDTSNLDLSYERLIIVPSRHLYIFGCGPSSFDIPRGQWFHFDICIDLVLVWRFLSIIVGTFIFVLNYALAYGGFYSHRKVFLATL